MNTNSLEDEIYDALSNANCLGTNNKKEQLKPIIRKVTNRYINSKINYIININKSVLRSPNNKKNLENQEFILNVARECILINKP